MSASHASTPDLPHQLAAAADDLARAVEEALQLPEPPSSWWHRPGVTPRGERWLEVVSSLVLMTIAIAWIWSIGATRVGVAEAAEPGATRATRSVAAALTRADAPSTAYLTDAALEAFVPLRGASGQLRTVQQVPGEHLPSELPAGAAVAYTDSTGGAVPAGEGTAAPARTGIWGLAVRVGNALRPVTDLNVITLRPLADRKNGRIGLYYIGTWPTEGRPAPRSGVTARGDYSAPRGLIEVTRENQDTPLSEHFTLRDFLTKGQANVWPKYLVVQPRLVDKLELVLADLESRGIRPDGIFVMSGFRTPQYNAGGGNTAGRANLSRHMYGDAADVWIDNDGNGRMDDLNGDGRIDVRDARVIEAAVDRVERAHPHLVGGVGVYPAAPGHGPFTHIDARGYRARWLGSGSGG